MIRNNEQVAWLHYHGHDSTEIFLKKSWNICADYDCGQYYEGLFWFLLHIAMFIT